MNQEIRYGASTSVIAAKLPPSSFSLEVKNHPDFPEVPYDDLVRVENAFRVLEDYLFGTLAQTRMFQLDASTIKTRADLREAVHELALGCADANIWRCIEEIATLRNELNSVAGFTAADHLFWLGTEPRGAYRSFRDNLEDGTWTIDVLLQALAEEYS